MKNLRNSGKSSTFAVVKTADVPKKARKNQEKWIKICVCGIIFVILPNDTAALRAPTYSAVWSLFLYASNIHKTTKKNEEADNP